MIEINKIKSKEQELTLTDDQRIKIYYWVSQLKKSTINEVSDEILNALLNSKHGVLKNELGRVIFHLQKNERLNSIIGMEKLVDGALIAARTELFRILESADKDAQYLAKKIKEIRG